MDRTIPRWLRVIFAIVAAQALLLVIVFPDPRNVSLLVPWPATPLNARFIASLYTTLGLAVLACVFARTFSQVRIILVGIGVATFSLLLLTIPWFGVLHPFPLWWTVFYVVDPIFTIFAFWRLGWGGPPPRIPNPLKPIWIVQAVLFGLAGFILLVFPSVAVSIWPWSLTVELSQMYSLHFLSLAFLCVLALREPRFGGVRILASIFAVLAVFVLGVSIYHIARFKPGISTVVWFVFFALQLLVFGGLQLRRPAPATIRETRV